MARAVGCRSTCYLWIRGKKEEGEPVIMTLIKNLKKLSIIANLALLTLIAAQVANAFYDYVAYRSRSLAANQESREEPVEEDVHRQISPIAAYAVIAERDLFRTKNIAAAVAPPEMGLDALAATKLNIRLWGTVTGYSPAYAVIEAKGPNNRLQQKLYVEGDAVESATIERIMDDMVVLDHNGTRQILTMQKYELGRAVRPVSRRRTANAIQRRAISRKVFDSATADVGQLLSQARLVPHRNGMLVTAIKPKSIFRRMGLINGDVLAGVDGRAFNSVDDALALYQSMKEASSVALQLHRRGRPMTIQYHIR